MKTIKRFKVSSVTSVGGKVLTEPEGDKWNSDPPGFVGMRFVSPERGDDEQNESRRDSGSSSRISITSKRGNFSLKSSRDGFNHVVDKSWKSYTSGSTTSELSFFKDNLKGLKQGIKSWYKIRKEKKVGLKMDLEAKIRNVEMALELGASALLLEERASLKVALEDMDRTGKM
ncbi:hypothetical protein L1987_69362 [Smallanthus sonchifolius]|uniref:Uncharacterized protein n=1 Tax=Smallanthus sonchifolius TaxID=185202 RepID=A0ACB9B773_9ASTR|nr:hypothetical protein L1987_69362 [Smallanthus sonchifolius]